MILEQDIRIGNYFLGLDGRPFIWTMGHFGLLSKKEVQVSDIIKGGIILTPGILEKAGFRISVYKGAEIDYVRGRLLVTWYGNGFVFVPHGKRVTDRRYEFLHELQNLVAALEFEEPIIEL